MKHGSSDGRAGGLRSDGPGFNHHLVQLDFASNYTAYFLVYLWLMTMTSCMIVQQFVKEILYWLGFKGVGWVGGQGWLNDHSVTHQAYVTDACKNI